MVTHSRWASDARSTTPEDPRSLGQLVSDLSEQAARLVRAEIDLAKAEVATKAKELGVGVALLAVAGVLALYTLTALLATAVLGLATVVSPWLAALIVSVVLLLVTAALALVGVKHVQKGAPPAPERALHHLQEDVETVKRELHR